MESYHEAFLSLTGYALKEISDKNSGRLPNADIRFIYFIESSDGVVKIGITKNIQHRFNNLSSSSPIKLNLISLWEHIYIRELSLEYLLHKSLSDNQIISGSSREWFNIDDTFERKALRAVGKYLAALFHITNDLNFFEEEQRRLRLSLDSLREYWVEDLVDKSK